MRTRASRLRTTLRFILIPVVILVLAGCAIEEAAEVPPLEQHYQAARAALLKGHPDKAKVELRLSLQSNPLHAKSHALLACLLAEEGEVDQALVGFDRARRLEPDDPDTLYNMGTALLWRGRAVPAAELLEQAVSIRPEYVRAYNNLAKAYFLSGLPEMGVATYGEALRLEPGNAVALRNLTALEETGLKGQAAPAPSEPRKDAKPDDAPPVAAAGGGSRPGVPGEEAVVDTRVEELREVLRDVPYVTVESRGGRIVFAGWTRDKMEREAITRVTKAWPDVLDLTTEDTGDSKRMIEVDATVFVATKAEATTSGFNFLRLVQLNFNYFAANARRSGTGFTAPATIGTVEPMLQASWLFAAAVDYDVNIANASLHEIALLARPHLTTLSGTPASFTAGGELVYLVSGINSGDIKPYPFGTILTVTPTLLRTPSEDGNPRIHVVVEVSRISVLSSLLAQARGESGSFSKLKATSQAVLDLGQTLILSGLNQRERDAEFSGVPVLRWIPILKHFFSNWSATEVQTATIILLTPRDPGFLDDRERKAEADFLQKRGALIRALQGTEEDMARFRERYPDWNQLPPNRFASHLFLLQNSPAYRAFQGQELSSEELEFATQEVGPKRGWTSWWRRWLGLET